jgi:hypothetical protein
MKFFRTKPTHLADDRPAVQAKLADCTAQIRAADAELSRLSLQVVMGGDATQALNALDKLRKLEQQHALLCAALVEAERQEQARERDRRSEEQKARRRALSQHAGKFARDAQDVSQALIALNDAQRRLETSGGSIVALLPPHLRCPARPFNELLAPKALAELIEVEAYRIAPQGRNRPQLFGYEDRVTGQITPLTDTLAALVSRIRSDFDQPLPAAIPASRAPSSITGDVPPSVADDRGLAAPPLNVTPRRGKQPPDSAIIRLTSPGVGLPLEPATETADEPTTAIADNAPDDAEPATRPLSGALARQARGGLNV